jgi:hypothetical protein
MKPNRSIPSASVVPVLISELTDWEYGERQYHAEDFAGHRWIFSETLRDTAPEEWGGQSMP